jgi:hypothetical protein
VDGGSRSSLRSARLSRAEFGCTLATPLLALRTWEVDMIPAQCHQLRGPKAVARFAPVRFASVLTLLRKLDRLLHASYDIVFAVGT